MPPGQQLEWLRFLRRLPARPSVSADMFEHFVETELDTSQHVCDSVDLVFMNDAEHITLSSGEWVLCTPAIVQDGSQGAFYCWNGAEESRAYTRPVDAVDTTGAGELLAGAYLALRAVGIQRLPALCHAVHLATASVSEFGVEGKHAMRTRAQIRRIVGSQLRAAAKPVAPTDS